MKDNKKRLSEAAAKRLNVLAGLCEQHEPRWVEEHPAPLGSKARAKADELDIEDDLEDAEEDLEDLEMDAYEPENLEDEVIDNVANDENDEDLSDVESFVDTTGRSPRFASSAADKPDYDIGRMKHDDNGWGDNALDDVSDVDDFDVDSEVGLEDMSDAEFVETPLEDLDDEEDPAKEWLSRQQEGLKRSKNRKSIKTIKLTEAQFRKLVKKTLSR